MRKGPPARSAGAAKRRSHFREAKLSYKDVRGMCEAWKGKGHISIPFPVAMRVTLQKMIIFGPKPFKYV